jgi:hypothetical protein
LEVEGRVERAGGGLGGGCRPGEIEGHGEAREMGDDGESVPFVDAPGKTIVEGDLREEK